MLLPRRGRNLVRSDISVIPGAEGWLITFVVALEIVACIGFATWLEPRKPAPITPKQVVKSHKLQERLVPRVVAVEVIRKDGK